MKYKGSHLIFDEDRQVLFLVTDKTATTAELTLTIGDTEYSATGSSWRVRGDDYDEYTGELNAVYRAVKQMENILRSEVERLES